MSNVISNLLFNPATKQVWLTPLLNRDCSISLGNYVNRVIKSNYKIKQLSSSHDKMH